MALTSADVGSTWVVSDAVGEGAGILTKGVTVSVTEVLTEPTAGVGGPFPAVLVTTESPAPLRSVSFPMDDFEKIFVASPSQTAEEPSDPLVPPVDPAAVEQETPPEAPATVLPSDPSTSA